MLCLPAVIIGEGFFSGGLTCAAQKRHALATFIVGRSVGELFVSNSLDVDCYFEFVVTTLLTPVG